MVQTTSPRPSTRRSSLRYRLPPWPRGPKPRRRTELGLLVFAAVITVGLYVIAELGVKNRIPDHLIPILGVILGLSMVGHVANRWLVPHANAVVLPIAALLNGVGYVVIVRWTPPAAKSQATWTALGMLLYVLTLVVVRHTRDLDRYRYLLLLLAGVLLVAPLMPGIGLDVNGARLWVHAGSLEFQPVELAKIILCVFFASYFAENKELLSIPTARLGNRLVLDPRPLVPILVAWGIAMLIIGVENDIGFAMLVFTMFIALLWVTTGRWFYLVVGVLLFAAGATLAAHLFPQVHERVSTWLNPWASPNHGGYDLVQSSIAMAHGGVGGAGLGRDPALGGIFGSYATNDVIFVSIADEMGFIGAAAVVMAFVLLMGAGLRIAQTARSDFAKLMATGLTVIVSFQAFFIMAGLLRILPFTGITLPFVAAGGSSLVANYVLIALLMRISEEGGSTEAEEALGIHQPGEAEFVVAS
ncbi:MAG: FtsW/RodA/SpoVE family cell cycle protein [Acidimicrobiales bacterium]